MRTSSEARWPRCEARRSSVSRCDSVCGALLAALSNADDGDWPLRHECGARPLGLCQRTRPAPGLAALQRPRQDCQAPLPAAPLTADGGAELSSARGGQKMGRRPAGAGSTPPLRGPKSPSRSEPLGDRPRAASAAAADGRSSEGPSSRGEGSSDPSIGFEAPILRDAEPQRERRVRPWLPLALLRTMWRPARSRRMESETSASARPMPGHASGFALAAREARSLLSGSTTEVRRDRLRVGPAAGLMMSTKVPCNPQASPHAAPT